MVALTTWISEVDLLNKNSRIIGKSVSYNVDNNLKEKNELYLDRAHMYNKIAINDCFYVKATMAPKNKICFMQAVKVVRYEKPTTLKTEDPKKPIYMYPSVHCKILGNVERLTKRMLKETV
jgi:Golgi nucleoside diphosphatase